MRTLPAVLLLAAVALLAGCSSNPGFDRDPILAHLGSSGPRHVDVQAGPTGSEAQIATGTVDYDTSTASWHQGDLTFEARADGRVTSYPTEDLPLAGSMTPSLLLHTDPLHVIDDVLAAGSDVKVRHSADATVVTGVISDIDRTAAVRTDRTMTSRGLPATDRAAVLEAARSELELVLGDAPVRFALTLDLTGAPVTLELASGDPVWHVVAFTWSP